MKSLVVCFSMLFFFAAEIYSQTIPNSDFENWTVDLWDNHNPVGWVTSNGDFQGAKITNDYGHQSPQSLKSINYGGTMRAYASCKISVTEHSLSLNAFARTVYSGADTVSIHVFATLNGSVVDSGKWMNTDLSPIGPWAAVSIPISQTSMVDSVEIVITGGITPGTMLYVDDLSLSFPTAISNQENNFSASIFPNPFTNSTTLYLDGCAGENVFLTIYDAKGQLVRNTSEHAIQKIDIGKCDLQNGLYLLVVLNEKQEPVFRKKLIVE